MANRNEASAYGVRRVAISGSTHWQDRDRITTRLGQLFGWAEAEDHQLVVVTGDCTGAEAVARTLASDMEVETQIIHASSDLDTASIEARTAEFLAAAPDSIHVFKEGSIRPQGTASKSRRPSTW